MRWLDLDALGVFALVYALMTLALTATRSLVLEPYLVRWTATPDLVRAGGRAAGACALVSAVLAAASVLAALVGPDSFRSSLLAAAVVLPFVLIQDSYRYVLFAQGRHLPASTTASGCSSPSRRSSASGSPGTTARHTCWGVGTGLPRRDRCGLRADPDGSPRLDRVGSGCASTATSAGPWPGRRLPSKAPAYSPRCSSVVSLETAALGAISASRTLLTPMTTLLTASMSFSVPEGVRWHARGPAALDRFVRSTSLVLSALVVVYCLAFLVVPTSWGSAVVGANWTSAISLLVPTGLWVLGMTASQGPRGRPAGARPGPRDAPGVPRDRGPPARGPWSARSSGATGAAWGFGIVSMIGQRLLWWTAYRAARRVEVPS